MKLLIGLFPITLVCLCTEAVPAPLLRDCYITPTELMTLGRLPRGCHLVMPQYVAMLNENNKEKALSKAKRSGAKTPNCDLNEHDYFAAVTHAIKEGNLVFPVDAECKTVNLVFTKPLGKPNESNVNLLNSLSQRRMLKKRSTGRVCVVNALQFWRIISGEASGAECDQIQLLSEPFDPNSSDAKMAALLTEVLGKDF